MASSEKPYENHNHASAAALRRLRQLPRAGSAGPPTIHPRRSASGGANPRPCNRWHWRGAAPVPSITRTRSEEHTSELQSLRHLVCRLLLEKKKRNEER